MKRLSIALFFVLLFLSSMAWGADLHVGASATGDESGSGAANLCTLAYANANLSAGETAYLYDTEGAYTDQQIEPVNSGTSGNLITYEAFTGDSPSITNGGLEVYTTGSSHYHILNLVSKAYIKIDGIEFGPLKVNGTKGGRWAWINDSDHIYLENCVFDNGANAAFSAYRLQNSSYLYHDTCTWTLNDVATDAEKQHDLIAWYGINHTVFNNCYLGDASHTGFGQIVESATGGNDGDYVVFTGCTIDNGWRVGLSGWHTQDFVMLDGNTFVNIGDQNHLCPWSDDRNRVNLAFEVRGIEKAIFRRNTLYGCDAGAGFYDVESNKYNWFYHNTFYDTDANDTNRALETGAGRYSGCPFYMDSSTVAESIKLNYFYNNLISEVEGISSTVGGAKIYVGSTAVDTDNIWDFNFVGDSSTTKGDFLIRWRTLDYLDVIDANNTQWSNTIEGGSDGLDPLMTDPDNQDFTLQQASPCIDAGRFLATVVSVDGNELTLGTNEAYAFFDGWGLDTNYVTKDTIYDDDGVSTTIVSVDAHNVITVADATGITGTDTLTVINYVGAASDIGAYEYDGEKQNTAPDGTYTPGGDVTIYTDVSSVVALASTMTDAEDDDMTYLWTVPGSDKDGSTDADPGNATFTCGGYPCTRSCSLKVTDEHGAYNTWSFTVYHLENTPTANNFTDDATALWSLEDGALTREEISDNDIYWTNDTVVSQTSFFKDGTHGGDWELDNTARLYRSGAANDFNWDSTNQLTICGWLKTESHAASGYLFSKVSDANTYDIFLVYNTDPEIRAIIGHTGGTDTEVIDDNIACTDGNEIHLCFSYDGSGSNKDYVWRIWDETASTHLSTATGSITNDKSWGEAGDLSLGAYIGELNHYDGQLDEWTVFDRILSTDEMDAKRTQQFPLAIIADEIGISPDGTYGTDATITIALVFKRKTSGSTYVPVDVTWTDGGTDPTISCTLDTAGPLVLTHSYPAPGVAGSVHYFTGTVAAGQEESDLAIASISLEDGTFTYGSPAINCDMTLAGDLAANAAIVINATAPDFTLGDFFHCDSDSVQIDAETTYTTDEYCYLCVQSDEDNLLFNLGPQSNVKLGTLLDYPSGTQYYDLYSGIGTTVLNFRRKINAGDRDINHQAEGVAEGTGFIHGATSIVNEGGVEVSDYELASQDPAGGNIIIAAPTTTNEPLELGTGEGADWPDMPTAVAAGWYGLDNDFIEYNSDVIETSFNTTGSGTLGNRISISSGGYTVIFEDAVIDESDWHFKRIIFDGPPTRSGVRARFTRCKVTP